MAIKVETAPQGGANDCPVIVEFILDETGSMDICKNATISGFNHFLQEQQSQSGECLMTLTKFSTASVHTPYVDLDIGMVPQMTSTTFLPGGGTNLYSTVDARLREIDRRIADWAVKPRVLVVIMTDGEDNASGFPPEGIAPIIRTKIMYGWTIAYLGATENALTIAHRMGIDDAKRFEVSDMHQTMATLSATTTAFRAGDARAFSRI